MFKYLHSNNRITKGLLDWWKLWPAGGGEWVLTLGAVSTWSKSKTYCVQAEQKPRFFISRRRKDSPHLLKGVSILWWLMNIQHNIRRSVLLSALFPQRTELLNLFKACSHHLLLGLVSDEPSTTFPLWKLDYNEKSGVTSNTTGSFDTSNPQRTCNTIPWSKTVSSKKQLVAVTYSWASSAFAKFHSERNGSSFLWMWKKQPQNGLFSHYQMSQSSNKLAEWLWQQDPFVFLFA